VADNLPFGFISSAVRDTGVTATKALVLHGAVAEDRLFWWMIARVGGFS